MYDIRKSNALLQVEFSVVPDLLQIPTASLFQHSAGALSAISYGRFVCDKAPLRVWMNLNLLVKCQLSIALVAAVVPWAGRAPSVDCSSRCVSSHKCVGWEILHPFIKVLCE